MTPNRKNFITQKLPVIQYIHTPKLTSSNKGIVSVTGLFKSTDIHLAKSSCNIFSIKFSISANCEPKCLFKKKQQQKSTEQVYWYVRSKYRFSITKNVFEEVNTKHQANIS